MPRIERDSSKMGQSKIDQRVDQPQKATLPILSENVSPDLSSGDASSPTQPSDYEALPYAPAKRGHPLGAIIDEEKKKLVEEARGKGLIERLPFGQREVIEQRYPSEGSPKTLEEIGRGAHVTRERIRQKETQAFRNIQRLKEGEPLLIGGTHTDVDTSEVVRLYVEEEKTETEIAHLMSCGHSTISSRLRAAGVPTRSSGRRRVKVNVELLALQYFTQGMRATDIAKALGISSYTVYGRLKEAGYQTRRIGRPRKK